MGAGFQNTAELINAITEAFVGGVAPGTNEVGRDLAGRKGWIDSEVVDYFTGRERHEVDWLAAEERFGLSLLEMLVHLSPRALAWFMPSLLSRAVHVARIETEPDYNAVNFVDELCYFLTRPSPTALADQHEIVKDMDEVPDDIKEALLNPGDETRATEAELVAHFDELKSLLTPEQRDMVKTVLAILAVWEKEQSAGAYDPAHNTALRAIKSAWG